MEWLCILGGGQLISAHCEEQRNTKELIFGMELIVRLVNECEKSGKKRNQSPSHLVRLRGRGSLSKCQWSDVRCGLRVPHGSNEVEQNPYILHSPHHSLHSFYLDAQLLPAFVLLYVKWRIQVRGKGTIQRSWYGLIILEAIRHRVAPEFITAYTVSEVESPLPRNKLQHERPEDNLSIEEVFIAPPLPRRPDYHNGGRRYGSRRAKVWAPPPTPSAYHRREYERGPLAEDVYDHDRRPEGNWGQHNIISPQLSDSSSVCSATDCEECAYVESRRRYGDHGHSRSMGPVPYVIVPGNSVGPRATPSPVSPHTNDALPRAYIHEAPRVYRLHNSTELAHASRVPPPTREASLGDENDASPITASQNQVVLFQGTGGSAGSGERVVSDGMSIMHSNVSSPRWSVAGQRYLSGSETRSDMQSRSPVTSLDGLYEHPDPRFAHHVHPPPGVYIQRPVVITRSDESYESDRFAEYDGYDGRSDVSSSDEGYSGSERSFSSDSSEYYSRDYEGRHW